MTPAEIEAEASYRYDEAKGRKCTHERAFAEALTAGNVTPRWYYQYTVDRYRETGSDEDKAAMLEAEKSLANAYKNPETLTETHNAGAEITSGNTRKI